jgi:hypothetical protein
MPKSKPHRSRMFRDFSMMKPDQLKANYLKNVDLAIKDITKHFDISSADLLFMVFIYDYEFFTLAHIAKAYHRSKLKLSERHVYPLVNLGYIYKHFDRYTPSGKMEDLIFHNETVHSYEIRYALSQKGRMMVAKFYRKVDGSEKLNLGES